MEALGIYLIICSAFLSAMVIYLYMIYINRIIHKIERIKKYWIGRLMQFTGLSYWINGASLHLGCGTKYLNGYINIDLDYDTADMILDIRKGLPFRNNSINMIYHSHVIEHLTLDENMILMKECLRILKPGGTLRIQFPDISKVVNIDRISLMRLIDDKLAGNYEYKYDRINEFINIMFYSHGHKHMFSLSQIHRMAIDARYSYGIECHLSDIDTPEEVISSIIELTK